MPNVHPARYHALFQFQFGVVGFRCVVLLPHFLVKKKIEKNVSHQHSRHTVCAGVSCMTEEGCHSSVSVCLVSGTGSAVRKVEGVFSVFLSKTWHLAAHIIRNAPEQYERNPIKSFSVIYAMILV